MKDLVLVATLALAAALILGGAPGNRSSAAVIPVPNSGFETLYKPGTMITGVVSAGGWSQGVGFDCPIDSGQFEFEDLTFGTEADIPGWVGYDRPGWINIDNEFGDYNGGTYGRRDWEDVGGDLDPGNDDLNVPDPLHPQRWGNLQGSVSAQGPLNGVHCYLGNGSNWGNPAGALIVSADPLTTVETGLAYTVSMMTNGVMTPVVLDLLADGVALTPSSSVDPPAGGWREVSRTYDATTLSAHVGEALTIVLGHGRPAAGTQNRYEDVSLVNFNELVWDNGHGDNMWGTPNNWDPDPLIPTATTPATINHGTPLVEADYDVLAVRINGGELTIGAGNTLTITNGINSDGTVVLQNGSRISTGSGSIAAATIDGRASIAVYDENNLDVISLSSAPGKAPGELVKEDAGTLTLHGDSLEADNLILAAGTMAVVGETDTNFTAAGDATLHLETASTANLGNLTLESGTVTLTGAPGGITFAGTTVDASATAVGLNPQTDTDLRVINGSNAEAVISKYGDRTLVLDELNAGLDMATFNVEGGQLVGVPAEGPAKADVNPFGAAQLEISRGELVLAGRVTDSAAAYENNVIGVSLGTLTAGSGGNGTTGVTVSVAGGGKSVTVNENASLILRSTDDYTLSVVGDLTGPGGVEVSEGTVALAAVDVGGMQITGGAVRASANLLVGTMQQNGGTLDLAGNLVRISDTLITASAAYAISEGDTFDATGDASGNMIEGVNLTLNVAGSTLSISGSVSGDGTIPVPNGEFRMYKPGTGYTVSAVFPPGNIWTTGMGDNAPINGELEAIYGDGTTGKAVDVPGWITPRDSQGSPTGTTDCYSWGYDPDGLQDTSCLNAFGEWSSQNGNLAESDAPLSLPALGPGGYYELSAMVTGNAGERTFDLLVDGVPLVPDSFVDPSYDGTWQEISRTYNSMPAGDVTILAGTARPGAGDPLLFGQRMRLDNISLWGTGFMLAELPGTNLLVTANSEVTSDSPSVTLGNLTIEEDVTLSDAEFSFADVTTGPTATVTLTDDPRKGSLYIRGVASPGGNDPGLLTVDGEFELGDFAEYACDLADWNPDTNPNPWNENPPLLVNDKITFTGNLDAYLSGTLTLRATSKLRVAGQGEQEWYGDQTRTIMDTVGESTISNLAAFLDVPAAGTHLGYGVFATDQGANGQVVTQTFTTVKVDLYQAQKGDANGDHVIDTGDMMLVFGNWTLLPPPDHVPRDWHEGNFSFFPPEDANTTIETGDMMEVFGNWTLPVKDAGDAKDGDPQIADLLYYPATGDVQLDPSEAAGEVITIFRLMNEAGEPDFNAPGEANFPWPIPDFLAVDTPLEIANTDLSGSGISDVWSLGAIFPTGLDQDQLEAFLTVATYVGSRGTGVHRLDLIVIPEPGTVVMLLGVVGGLLLLVIRRRAGTR